MDGGKVFSRRAIFNLVLLVALHAFRILPQLTSASRAASRPHGNTTCNTILTSGSIMKVILTGCTGFTGGEVLEQCIQHPSITSVVVLSRRQLPASVASNPKVQVVIMDDFLSYNDDTLRAIEGADACIWSLGKPGMAGAMDNATVKKVHVDYPMATARAITEQRKAAAAPNHKFRFICLTGLCVTRDQNKPLWIMQDYLRIRGQVENELLAHAKENSSFFESYIFRPAFILPKQSTWKSMFLQLAPSVRVDALGKLMVETALNGYKADTWEHSDIVEAAKKIQA
ncbi:hypothetical protein B0T17DRAFT_517851 [Bombardia bombarda]|uniref:NAD(P)-binding domain-containing protein n=1 Tax=Bombardia bombarda TaxID=252184 RepID=A0AA39XL31_9PEZI|nr:hypothetical protein B0T17DRAFT_517851 [Bombardia bombarda]